MPSLETRTKRSVVRRIGLAVTIGAIVGFQCWRIALYGPNLPFGLPPAAFGLVAVGIGLVAALLIAVIANRPWRATSARVHPHSAAREPRRAFALRQRLANRKARLDRLDADRKKKGTSGAAAFIGERIIWNELLELELQDIDEQVSRISRRLAAAQNLGASTDPKPYVRKGERHAVTDQRVSQPE